MREKIHTLFFLPPIHRLPTGGNIYNRKIIQALKPHQEVEIHIWETDSTRNWNAHDGSLSAKPAIAIIDSLLVSHVDAIKSSWDQGDIPQLVLLIHYLHLVDPKQAHSAKAQDEKEMLKAFDWFVTTSQFSKGQLIYHGIPQEQIQVIRPGLDLKYQKRLERSDIPNIPHILTISSMIPQKGLLEFIEILEDLQDYPWNWILVGDQSLDPDFCQQFHHRLHHSNIAKRTHVHGSLSEDQVFCLYDQSHVFVLPSQFETCSMVTMEAMARGLPVIAYHVGGISENILNSKAGCLIPSGNTKTFSKTLQSLLESPEQCLALGRAAQTISHSFLTWDQAGHQFYQLLHSISHGTS